MAVSNDKTRIQITLTKETHEKVQQEAAKRGVSKSALISIIVSEWMADKGL